MRKISSTKFWERSEIIMKSSTNISCRWNLISVKKKCWKKLADTFSFKWIYCWSWFSILGKLHLSRNLSAISTHRLEMSKKVKDKCVKKGHFKCSKITGPTIWTIRYHFHGKYLIIPVSFLFMQNVVKYSVFIVFPKFTYSLCKCQSVITCLHLKECGILIATIYKGAIMY